MKDKDNNLTIHIANSTILKIVVIVLGIPLVYYLSDVLALFFIAIILMSALSPVVQFFRRKFRFSLIASILTTYIISILTLSSILLLVIPPAIRQLTFLIKALPLYLQKNLESLGFISNVEQLFKFQGSALDLINSSALQFIQSAYSVSVSFLGFLIAVTTVAVVAFYLLVDNENVEKALIDYFPLLSKTKRKDLASLFKAIEIKLGYWARGQFFLMLVIAVMTYIGLLILQVEYALPLAIVAGFLEIVPVIGPILSAVPAIIVVAAQDPVRVVFIIALYTLVQQLENHFIVPQIMRKAVGFSPVLTIFAILVGERLLGIKGALLAVPLVATIFVIIDHYKSIKQT